MFRPTPRTLLTALRGRKSVAVIVNGVRVQLRSLGADIVAISDDGRCSVLAHDDFCHSFSKVKLRWIRRTHRRARAFTL